MKLGDLEFSPGDFIVLQTGQFCGHPEHQMRMLAEIANRLLKERLQKEPEVFGLVEKGHRYPYRNGFASSPCSADTHRARLVCIEELHQKESKTDLHPKACKDPSEHKPPGPRLYEELPE